MTHSPHPHPHRPPRSPQSPLRPLRRVIPKEPGPMNQQNHCWLAAYASSADARSRIHWRNRLVEGNLGLVHSVAARFAAISPLPYADLVQVGCQGLIRAVEAFDERRARCLSTFAIPYVRGAIQHELRDREAWIRPPRRIWELRQKARTFQDARRASGLPPLGRPELAAALGCTPAELDETERLQEVAHPLSLDALQCSSEEVDGAGTWLDQLADPQSIATVADGREPVPQLEAHRPTQLAWLRQQLNRLDPLQRDLVLARVLVGCSWVELGQQHGLHPRMAERRCSAALRQLRQGAEVWRAGGEA
jgi:RNA polymerase sigma-B factor